MYIYHASHLSAIDLSGVRTVAQLQQSNWAKEMEFLTPGGIKEMAMFPVARRASKPTVRGKHFLGTLPFP